MTPHDALHKRLRQLAKSYLRTSDADADFLATQVADSHSRIGAFFDFCMAPGARSTALNGAIISRWLSTSPGFLECHRILALRNPVPGIAPAMSEQSATHIFDAAFEVAQTLYGLPSDAAGEFAHCIERAASPSLAYYQRCVAPGKHSLEQIFHALATYMTGAIPHAVRAGQLLGTHSKGQLVAKAESRPIAGE